MNQQIEKLKAFGKKILDKLKSLSKKVYIIAAAVLVVIAAAVVLFLYNRPYETLLTGASDSETAAVLKLLDTWGVRDYKVQDGDTILVPKSQQPALQARILMENVTQTGYFYNTYLDNINALSTESERSILEKMDLQEKLRATICAFENVRDASVTITPGENRSYVLDSNNVINASASVLVTMQSGTKLDTKQASAIRQLVKNSVQGLEIDKITLTDTFGNQYSGADLTADSDASALKIQLQEEYENEIRTEVMNILTPFYGEDNVKVGVNCVVEIGNTTENREEHWLPEYAQDGSTGGRGVIDQEQWQWSYERDGEVNAGGIVGTETNADMEANFPGYVENTPDLDGTENAAGASGQINYKPNSSEKQIVTTAGYLTDCTISVSINSATAGNVDVDFVRQHAARAAGIHGVVDEETGVEDLSAKISVMCEPFYTPPIIDPGNLMPQVDLWIVIAAGAGVLLFLIILLIVLIVSRKRRKKRQRMEEEERQRLQESSDIDAILAAAGVAESAPTGADVMSMQSERSMELRKDIRQFASENPEIAAQMVRAWLRGGEENG